MSVYRITRFAAPNMGKLVEHVESLRSTLQTANADFIDVVDYGNGKGVVIAKYANEAAMEAASEIAQNAFGQMVEAGLIEADSIHPHMGNVAFSV